MKQIFLCTIVLSLAACGNSGNKTVTDDTTAPIRPGIENVNGNIPDTGNSITLDTNDTTVKKDSVPR